MVQKPFLVKPKDLKCYYIFILSEFKNPNISPLIMKIFIIENLGNYKRV